MVSVNDLRVALRLTDSPVVRTGLSQTILFFQSVLHADPMDWCDQLQGVDFHGAVRITTLRKNTTLVRYDDADDPREVRRLKPFGFFTKPGVSPFQLGISWQARNHKRFNVVTDCQALESVASSISFAPRVSSVGGHTKATFDQKSRVGGGVQYILSRSDWPKLIRVSDTKRV